MKFAILGFFEDLMTVQEPIKCLGTRRIPYDPTRKLGSGGRREITITEPYELQRGHKVITYKASKKKPLVVVTSMQMLNGKSFAEHEDVGGPYYSTVTRQVYGIPNFAG